MNNTTSSQPAHTLGGEPIQSTLVAPSGASTWVRLLWAFALLVIFIGGGCGIGILLTTKQKPIKPVSNDKLRVFSETDNYLVEVHKYISKAQKEILISVDQLKSKAIIQVLEEKSNSGISVIILLSLPSNPPDGLTANWLRDHKIGKVYFDESSYVSNVVIIDRKIAIISALPLSKPKIPVTGYSMVFVSDAVQKMVEDFRSKIQQSHEMQ